MSETYDASLQRSRPVSKDENMQRPKPIAQPQPRPLVPEAGIAPESEETMAVDYQRCLDCIAELRQQLDLDERFPSIVISLYTILGDNGNL